MVEYDEKSRNGRAGDHDPRADLNQSSIEFRKDDRKRTSWIYVGLILPGLILGLYIFSPAQFWHTLYYAKSVIDRSGFSENPGLTDESMSSKPADFCDDGGTSSSSIRCNLLFGNYESVLNKLRIDLKTNKLRETGGGQKLFLYTLALIDLNQASQLNRLLYRNCPTPSDSIYCQAREIAGKLWSRTAPLRNGSFQTSSLTNHAKAYYFYSLGVQALSKGRNLEAEKHFKSAIDVSTNDNTLLRFRCLLNLSEISYRKGGEAKLSSLARDFGQELKHYGAASRLPDRLIKLLSGDKYSFDKSLRSDVFDFVYVYAPGQLSILVHHGLVLGASIALNRFLKRVYSKFVKMFSSSRKAHALWRKHGFHLLEARILIALGQFDRVAAVLRGDRGQSAQHLLGVVSLRSAQSKADFRQSRRYFMNADKNNFDTTFGLALSELRMGRLGRTKAAMKKIRSDKFRPKKVRKLLQGFLKAEKSFVQGEFSQSIRIFEKLTKNWPNYYYLWTSYLRVLRAAGHTQSAIVVAKYLKESKLSSKSYKAFLEDPLGPLSGQHHPQTNSY